MSGGNNQQLVPKDQSLIYLTGGIGILIVVVKLLEERFSPLQTLPWKYTGDPNTSTIHIINQFDEDSDEGTNLMPRIVARLGSTACQRNVLGDLGPEQPGIQTRGNSYHMQQATTQYEVMAYGKSSIEARILAEISHGQLAMSADVFRRNSAVRQVSPMVIGSPRKDATRKEYYKCPVSFTINTEMRWHRIENDAVIKRASIYINNNDESTRQIDLDERADP